MSKPISIYTEWFVSLSIHQKREARQRAGARAEEALAQIMARSGTTYSKDPAVMAVLDVTARQLLDWAMDIEMLILYQEVHHPDTPVDIGSNI